MHEASVASQAEAARAGDSAWLAEALRASRLDTLATFEVVEAALPNLAVPQLAQLNPPLWELGHIGWFQSHWLGRNPQRDRGVAADPDAPRLPASSPEADALYDSSRVAHDTRWSLPLPDARQTRDELARQLDDSLARLAGLPHDDTALYFFRLVLLHEDMHHEASLYMAQSLGIAIDDPRWQPARLPAPPAPLAFDASRWRLGHDGPGFVFDNERAATTVDLDATRIDAQAVRWAEFLPFVEAGGYGDDRWWSRAGLAWRQTEAAAAPRYLRRGTGPGQAWQAWRHGRWQALRPDEAACHLTLHEAEAWCRWAGRRLPTEAEWERAALSAPQAFRWGDVWEWTASPFQPYPGFVPHPYRAYSAPWFDGRRVLRGGSHLTQPRLKHPRYRNFFPAHRHDVPAGFRSCAR